MSGMVTGNTSALTRAELWSNELKDVLTDELMMDGFVRWLDNFPDGDHINIPSIGELDAYDYVEDQAVSYSPLDLGQFQLTINRYKQAGTYITNKAKQDMFYMSELVSTFVPKEARAIKRHLEIDIMNAGQPVTGNPAGSQVAGSRNDINGAAHRKVAAGTLNTKKVLGVEDFAYARYALKKANVPDRNLIALVDPSTEFVMNTLANLTNVSNNPRWEGVLANGIGSENHFVANIYGFDVYTSNYLPKSGTDQTGASETINSVASGAGAVGNLFFSAVPDLRPWIGAWRQMPKVDGEYNKDFQREEYVTTARYGVKLYRPENLVTILSDPSAVA